MVLISGSMPRAPDGNTAWICAIEGLATAKGRMEQIATEKQGRYFTFLRARRNGLRFPSSAKKPESKSG